MAPPSSSSSSSASPAAKMVGFDKYMDQLLDRLKRDQPSRQTIPIVGMGGIGKTTLARNAYNDSLIMKHFDVRAWVVVSQQFNTRNILLQALSSLSPKGSTREWEKTDATDDQLHEKLHKILFGRRYLIVLDDVWSVEDLENIKLFLRDNNNGSRIVVTTRQRVVVSPLGSFFTSPVVEIEFLDEENSWELFCDKAFAQKCCPPELQGVGKEIVEKCGGLPLAITVIGSLLGKSPMTLEYWEKIARDKSQILEDSGEGNKVWSILYISYKHLRVYLKSCFLFMGLFPEYHKTNKPQLIQGCINMSQLSQLWVAQGVIIKPQLIQLLVAQGFIRGQENKSMKEVAESYLNDLVDRNLLLVRDYIISDSYSICYLHDEVREMCVRVAEKENFYCVQRLIGGTGYIIADKRNARRFYSEESLDAFERPSLITPLAFNDQVEGEAPFKSRLFRTILIGDISFLDLSPQLVNLRFFMATGDSSEAIKPTPYSIPSEISLCWCLHTLVLHVQHPVHAPSRIWMIPHLRHIDVRPTIYLDDPPEEPGIVLHSLQTLMIAGNLTLSEEMCKRMPKITELEIQYDMEEAGVGRGSTSTWHVNLQNLGRFNKLEILRYSCRGKECVVSNDDTLLQSLKLPISLRELTLWGCRLLGGDMSMLASLPSLQILKLRRITVVGSEWNFDHEEGFSCLEHLEIIDCDDLREWSDNSSCFPKLRTLHLQLLSKLEGIPPYIGEIPSLRVFFFNRCSESATWSAIEMVEIQEYFGNEELDAQLIFDHADEADKWRDEIQKKDSEYKSLRISSMNDYERIDYLDL